MNSSELFILDVSKAELAEDLLATDDLRQLGALQLLVEQNGRDSRGRTMGGGGR